MPDDLVSIDEYMNARKDVAFSLDGQDAVQKQAHKSSWNPEARTARFVMSAEVEDRDRDIIYQAGLDITDFEKNPQAFHSHRSRDFPIGSWEDVQKMNTRPKRTEGTLKLMAEGVEPEADRVAVHIAAGTLRACSIGFLPKSIKRRPPPEGKEPSWDDGFDILEAKLLECSVVSIPANPAAMIKAAKDGDMQAIMAIEKLLDEWTPLEMGLFVPKAKLEAALKAAQEKTIVTVSDPIIQELGDPPKEDRRGWMKRAIDLFTNAEANEARLEQEAQAKRLKEAQDIVERDRKAADEAARKAVLIEKNTALEERLRSKGLVA
jgi:HK97 family phage prohead protease